MRKLGVRLLLLLLCYSCTQASEFDRGMEAYSNGQYAQANRLFSSCINRKERVRSALFYKGQSLSALNDHDSLPAAVAAFGTVYLTRGATDSHNVELTWKSAFNLGDLYYRMERYQQALASFQMASRLNPQTEGINYNLGVCLLALDRPREAARYLVREYQHGDASAQEASALAEAYLLGNRPDSARMVLQKTLLQHPAYAPAVVLQQELDSLTKSR